MPFYTYPLIYAISIVVGLINYKKYKDNKFLKLFLYFLIYSFLSEVIAISVYLYFWKPTSSVYSTWNILNLFFYGYFIFNGIRSKQLKRFIKILIAIFIVVTTINIVFFTHFFSESMVYNTLFSKSLVAIFTIFYFFDILKSDEILNIDKSLSFWILLGVFLYNVGFVPAFALVKYISFFGIFVYITFGLNIIMHLCFITGFIVSKKEFNN
jgi:hypothetical protein